MSRQTPFPLRTILNKYNYFITRTILHVVMVNKLLPRNGSNYCLETVQTIA